MSRRLAALAALALFGALAVLGVASPLWALVQSQLEWRDDAAKAIARDRGLLKIEAEVKKQALLSAASSIGMRLYPPGNRAAAETLLQSDVAALLKDANVWGQSSSQLPSSESADLYRVGVRFSVSMTIEQLKNYFARLEQYPRYMHVGTFDVTAPNPQSRDQNAILTVSMEVFGFGVLSSAALPGKPASAPADAPAIRRASVHSVDGKLL